uniref:3'-5' exonuclease domain-containing protein n=1 Tax=Macrostomum lignano TaxID=282301 RepID=A0A1I8IDZ4_9PLAT
ANFNEATNANCVLVTTAIGVERALAALATADLLAVLCHGANLRGQAKTSSRPSLISVAMPINDINSRVFLFDLDSCTAAVMSGLAKLLSSCREPYNRHLVVVSYDCRLLKRHLPMLDCSANDANVKFVDLQVLSTTLQQLYSDGKCSHACRGLYCLMQTYLGKPDPYKEPRAREDFLVEDSAVWRRRPLHPALLVASYDKSRQVLPLYNEMLSALLNPVYRASKDRIQLAKAEESGLPSDYFCSIPSQAALDQMRNLRVKGDALAKAEESGLPSDYFCSIPSQAALDQMRNLRVKGDAADSAQQSRGRCRGGSSAALQQRQQQSPCSPITSSTANSTVGSLTPNHSSLPSFGFGRGRGGSGGSG